MFLFYHLYLETWGLVIEEALNNGMPVIVR